MAGTEPRYVFDTNTLISAALFVESVPGLALRVALERGELLSSADTLAELAEVLNRLKFDRYLTVAEREDFFEAFVARTKLIEPTQTFHACRDPRDDKFLELAVAGSASAVVTGDDDLLALHPFRGVSILTPRQLLEAER